MQKTLIILALSTAGLSGCSLLSPTPLPVERPVNPRVVQRDLAPQKTKAALAKPERVQAKSLAANPSDSTIDPKVTARAEITQLINDKAVPDPDAQRNAPPQAAAAGVTTYAVASPTAPVVAGVQAISAAAPAAPVAFKQAWKIKPEHKRVRDVIEDWAAEAGGKNNPAGAIDATFETRDFPLSIPREKIISTGDFWDAMKMLGEAFRFSDAAFQVQPTRFQQIIIIPMNKSNGTKAN